VKRPYLNKISDNMAVNISLSEDNPDSGLWESREEMLIYNWEDIAMQKSIAHDTASHHYRKLHQFFGFVNIVMTVVCISISREKSIHKLSTMFFMIMGTLSAITTFYNFSVESRKHKDYHCRYHELSMSIKIEMCKQKHLRIACDIFLSHTEMILNTLSGTAPHF
jgi:hypothetical protein